MTSELIHDYQNLGPDEILDAVESQEFHCDGRLSALSSYISKRIVLNAEKIHVQTESIKRKFDVCFKYKEIHVIPNGIDHSHFSKLDNITCLLYTSPSPRD